VRGATPPVQQLQATSLLAATQFAPPLQGSVVDTTGSVDDALDWSARWAGQLYVTTPGAYTVRVNSDDGTGCSSARLRSSTVTGRATTAMAARRAP